MRRSGAELLRETLTHMEIVRGYAESTILGQVQADAICMRLSAGIEMLGHIGEAWDRRFGTIRVLVRTGILLQTAGNAAIKCWPIALPSGIGTALPIWRAIEVLDPTHL